MEVFRMTLTNIIGLIALFLIIGGFAAAVTIIKKKLSVYEGFCGIRHEEEGKDSFEDLY